LGCDSNEQTKILNWQEEGHCVLVASEKEAASSQLKLGPDLGNPSKTLPLPQDRSVLQSGELGKIASSFVSAAFEMAQEREPGSVDEYVNDSDDDRDGSDSDEVSVPAGKDVVVGAFERLMQSGLSTTACFVPHARINDVDEDGSDCDPDDTENNSEGGVSDVSQTPTSVRQKRGGDDALAESLSKVVRTTALGSVSSCAVSVAFFFFFVFFLVARCYCDCIGR
jgi:hypothetical protein